MKYHLYSVVQFNTAIVFSKSEMETFLMSLKLSYSTFEMKIFSTNNSYSVAATGIWIISDRIDPTSN